MTASPGGYTAQEAAPSLTSCTTSPPATSMPRRADALAGDGVSDRTHLMHSGCRPFVVTRSPASVRLQVTCPATMPVISRRAAVSGLITSAPTRQAHMPTSP